MRILRLVPVTSPRTVLLLCAWSRPRVSSRYRWDRTGWVPPEQSSFLPHVPAGLPLLRHGLQPNQKAQRTRRVADSTMGGVG